MMPPYRTNASMAQQRKMFALADEGKVSMTDAVGRAEASKGKNLPERVNKDGLTDLVKRMKRRKSGCK